MRKTIFTMAGLLMAVSFAGCNKNTTTEDYVVDSGDMITHNQIIADIPISDLSKEEQQGLIQMREEEKLARDVYTTLGKQRGIQIFSNIASSEQTHTDAIKDLLDRYQIDDPVKDDNYGIFTSAEIQNLYYILIEKGKASLIDALIVGATIEDLDIKDLQNFSKTTDNQDILLTYTNLEKGSRNHLRAYIKQVKKNGGTYTPQYISQTEFDAIITSSQETGLQKNQK